MRITVSVPDELAEAASEAAEAEGRSVSSLFAAAVEGYLAERARRKAAARIGGLIGSLGDADAAVAAVRADRERSDR